MTQPINEAGYETIRDFVVSQWDYVEVRDSNDDPITRIQISNDARAQWTHADSDQVLVIELDLSGADEDIPTQTTITGTASYQTDSGGDELAYDSFPNGRIETEDDSILILHQIPIPQVN